MASPAVKPEREITDKQRAFAEAYIADRIAQSGFSMEDLALAAGYRGNQNVLRVLASRAIRHPAVLAYLRKRSVEIMQEGCVDVAVGLRELSSQRADRRTRMDAIRTLGMALGMTRDDGQGGGQGAGLVLNLHFAGAAGTLLTQAAPRIAQVIDHAPQSEPDRHRIEAGGASTASKPSRAARGAKGGVGVWGTGFTRRGRGGGGRPHAEPPESVGREIWSRWNFLGSEKARDAGEADRGGVMTKGERSERRVVVGASERLRRHAEIAAGLLSVPVSGRGSAWHAEADGVFRVLGCAAAEWEEDGAGLGERGA